MDKQLAVMEAEIVNAIGRVEKVPVEPGTLLLLIRMARLKLEAEAVSAAIAASVPVPAEVVTPEQVAPAVASGPVGWDGNGSRVGTSEEADFCGDEASVQTGRRLICTRMPGHDGNHTATGATWNSEGISEGSAE